jgi:6-phosphofructokinase
MCLLINNTTVRLRTEGNEGMKGRQEWRRVNGLIITGGPNSINEAHKLDSHTYNVVVNVSVCACIQ